MNQRKLRILLVGENPLLSTGYAVYEREVLERLVQTQKYEFCLLGAYGDYNDKRYAYLPYHYISSMPNPAEPREVEVYKSDTMNQFGKWKFEDACIKFRPDVVWSVRDIWVDAFICRSPFRKFFHHVMMPAVDSETQTDEWLSWYLTADGIMGYTQWGLDVVRNLTNGKARTLCPTPPGFTKEYEPVANRGALKESMGLPPSTIIIGMVARNQMRKLFPDLAEAFNIYLSKANEDLRKRSLLYFHTAHPDMGWDIPYILSHYGIASKTLFTYICANCSTSFPAFYEDNTTVCKACGVTAAKLTNSNQGVNPKMLANIYNLMDVHVLHSIAEGFGIPTVEAAACGTYVMATDYSASGEVIKDANGTPIKVSRMVWEAQTHRRLAMPDNEDLANKLVEFLSLPSTLRLKKGLLCRKSIEAKYNYARTAQIWDEYFGTLTPKENTWTSPAKYVNPNGEVPDGLSNSDFVKWTICNIAGRPDLATGYIALQMVKYLNWGIDDSGKSYTRQNVLDDVYSLAEWHNMCETKRTDAL